MRNSTKTRDLDERRALASRLREELVSAARGWPRRPAFVTTAAYGCEPEWVGYERERMRAGVNAYRARRNLPDVEMTSIAAVELLAYGHVDYARKFALYRADLAFDA